MADPRDTPSHSSADPGASVGWFLEGSVDDSGRIVRVPLTAFPFTIGRRPDQGLCVKYHGVSGRHAVIAFGPRGLTLRDLDSTNGTWVNRRRVGAEAPVYHGDVLHFATREFRLVHEDAFGTMERTLNSSIAELDLPRFFEDARGLRQMLDDGHVQVVFQPIVALEPGGDPAFEALGRASVDGVPRLPHELFSLAAKISVEDELSRVFRTRAVEEAGQLPGLPTIFLNSRPGETETPGFLAGMRHLREARPEQPMVLEIHETAVTAPSLMRALHKQLAHLDMKLAYDDFGAGQARLVELVEAPPDYLKFDMSLVRGLHEAPAQKQQMVHTLVSMVRDMGILAVAEGVETEADATCCRQMGFHLAQGWHFGRPAAAPSWQR